MSIQEIIELSQNVGLPIVILVALYLLVKKHGPKLLDYFTHRQTIHDEQVLIIVKVAEQSNVIISQNTAAMERNTIAFENYVMSHTNIINSISSNHMILNDIKGMLEHHDKRAEYMNGDIRKTLNIITNKELGIDEK